MKICIYGAGAIGGYLGVLLKAGGADVSLIARGAHLEAIKAHGLKLVIAGKDQVAHMPATSDPTELGPQDYVIVALKSHQALEVADDMKSLLGPDTAVVTAQNGIPWWYFFKHGGPHEGVRLKSVDPKGVIADHLPIDAIIAGIVYQAAEIESPGVIRHIESNRFPLAEIDGSKSERVAQLSRIFFKAGFKSPVIADVRAEIWTKLWGNLAFNPISALARAMLDDICRFPPTRALAGAMMREAQVVGEAFGVRFRISVEQRIAGAESIGAHKTSMLQDIEHGRAIEIDALLGSVVELARLADVATPHLDAAYAVAKLLGDRIVQSASRPTLAPA
jgi:2-dehydropantoate 2-reductase